MGALLQVLTEGLGATALKSMDFPRVPYSACTDASRIIPRSDHMATLQQVFVEPDPFEAGALPPFQQRPATVSTPVTAPSSPTAVEALTDIPFARESNISPVEARPNDSWGINTQAATIEREPGVSVARTATDSDGGEAGGEAQQSDILYTEQSEIRP